MKRFLKIALILPFFFLGRDTFAQYALDFDAGSEYVNLGNNASLDITGDITLELWVNIDNYSPDWVRLIGKGTFTNRTYGFWISNTGQLLFQLWGTTNMDLFGPVVPVGGWHHIAAVRSGVNAFIYLDGVLVASTNSFTGVPFLTPNSATLAGAVVMHDYLNGRIDEARIWNAARTQAEIQANINTCNLTHANLVANYTMEDGTGSSSVADISGNGNNGTLTNMDSSTDWVPGATICSANTGERLILNGGFINITNNAKLVVDNSTANAITRVSGHIISENANNEVKWVLGNVANTYTVPFGYSTTDYMPVTFTKTAGTGAGVFNFATYRTSSWQNSTNLPAAVTAVNDADGNDNSAFLIDRFWKIDANGYTAKPDLTNLTFTYIDAEHSVASNTIIESTLFAQRYNTTTNDWGDFLPTVTLNTANNTVVIPSVPSADFFNWWTLVSTESPLPVTLLTFKGRCENNSTVINWSTSEETDNDYFVLEKSEDALSWTELETVKSKGNNSDKNDYSVTDKNSNGLTYYRLKMVDKSNKFTYSSVITTQCGTDEPEMIVYPNPNLGVFVIKNAKQDTEIAVMNSLGQELQSIRINSPTQVVTLDLPAGMYVLVPKTETGLSQTIRLVIEK